MGTELELKSPNALLPYYKMESMNEAVSLYSGKAVFRFRGEAYVCRADVTFNWTPGPSVDVSVVGTDQATEITSSFWTMDFDGDDTSLELPELSAGVEFGVLIIRPVPFDERGLWSFSGTLNDWPDTVLQPPARRALFHVANLREFIGKPIQQNGGGWNPPNSTSFRCRQHAGP